ncbi:MAG: YdcF family protein [Hespellia sp.]|nr:YdcF family protein [Hespellia sp.]
MDLFVYPMVRLLLYLVTIGIMIFSVISIYRERRRMLNCVLLILSIVLLWKCITVVEGYVYAKDVTGPVILPLMILAVIFAIGMIANGLIVISKEGFSIAHSLSLLVGAAIIVFIAAYLGLILYVLHLQELSYGVYSIPRPLETAFFFCMEIAAYVPLMMVGFVLYSVIYQKLPIKKNPDYIVVLGCGLSGDHVTPLLASRLDCGITLDKKRGCKSTFLVSGGKGSDEVISEAQAMENYLLEQGIPENRILKEDRSTTTRENLIFSKKIMEERTKDYYCVIATNNFHVLRAAIFAKAQGLNGEVIGGKTASYYHPVAVIREHVALILAYKKLFLVYAVMVFLLNICHYLMIL